MEYSSEKIAIIGLGCILPDANSPAEFWANVLQGHSALRPLSSRNYDWSCYGRDSEHAKRLFERPIGAELDVHAFDWRKFKIAPLDAQGINPAHLHVLEAGAQAVEHVKYVPHASAGVFVGGTGLGWRLDSGFRIRLPGFLEAADGAGELAGLPERTRHEVLQQVQQALEERLLPVSDDGVVNSLASIAAGRLALRFDLRGPHAGIDAGFASGLAAIATASRLLVDGTIDLALAGATSESISPLELLAFDQLAVLAHNQVRPFDAAAEGTLLGEGVVLFALKRLEDALAQGEQIYAVLRGTGAASDGRSGSLLAPSVDGQSLAMRRAYAEARIEPSTVGYIECHATGTPIGDATELRTLTQVFANVAAGVAIGSAKPFVGHLRGASGAVGLLRAVLALHHRTIPAQIGFEKPHPSLGLDSSPFFVPTQPQELEPRGGAASPRAAVSSFGLGGSNYHAVLEAFDERTHRDEVVTASNSPRSVSASEPLAIIGLGGVLPDAVDVPAFWKLLVEGSDTTREVPESRWYIERYYDSDQKRLDTTYTRIGCFVEPLPKPGKNLRVPPVARVQIDPGQMLAFQATEQAVADAELESGNWDRARTAVIFGFIPCQGRRHLAEARLNFREFEQHLEQALLSHGVDKDQTARIISDVGQIGLADLPPITEDTLPGYLGSINAARIARHFDLHGPHFVVESACASSLAALHAGARLLRQGIVDTVILGGVWADGQPEFFVQNCRFSALSASAITPFDERASGFIPGEGAAVLVLRRLVDAERDGQRVHAVIRSVEGSTDGAAGRSVYSPSVEGESLAAKRALAAARIAPSLVDYVECHGTGTALGDVVEVEACTRAYGSGRARPLLIGSVKSNIGHLMAGAGAVSLLKTALAVREGLIPPSLKVEKLNPKIDFDTGPVEVVTSARSWTGPEGQPRRAGVSGFGLGGTNYHVILEEHRPREQGRVTAGHGPSIRRHAPRVLPIAVATGSDVAACVQTLKALGQKAQGCDAEQYRALVGASQAAAIGDVPCRLAIVADDPDALSQRMESLASAFSKGHDVGVLRARGIFFAQADTSLRVAALFPGQGPQYPNMLRDAATVFPDLAESLERIDCAYENLCGRKLRPSYWTDNADTYLQSDEDIHCAVFGVNVALYRLLQAYGVRIDAVMGQSAGELSALVAARAISLEDGLRAIRERTLAVLAIQTPDPGSMVALACGAERAALLLRDLPGYAALAADNGPTACIVSGDRQAVDGLLKRAVDDGIKATVLQVSHGYHSQLIAAARPRYRKALDSIRFNRPALDLYSTITGDTINGLLLERYPAHLESQFVAPVRLQQAVTALHRDGVRLFVECGPKWPLTTFVSEILTGLPYAAQATVHPKVGEVEQLHRALACLFVHRACSLMPARNSSMTLQNSSVSDKPLVASSVVAEPPQDGREAALLNALRAIRDVVEDALLACDKRAVENPQEQNATVEETAAVEQVSSVFNCISEPDSSGDATAEPLPRRSEGHHTALQDVRSNVHSLLLAELIKRTGYPEDMLDPNLDLEAELGIDTVKQVAALAAVREHYGLAPDPSFRMQDARTIRQAIDYLFRRVSSAPATAVSSSSATSKSQSAPVDSTYTSLPSTTGTDVWEGRLHAVAPPVPPVESTTELPLAAPDVAAAETCPGPNCNDVARLLIAELVKRTGYPEDMLDLDLDLEAELGIDTVKQVAALAAVREKFGLPQDPQFRMQDARTLRQAIDYLNRRIRLLGSPAVSAPAPVGGTECPNPLELVGSCVREERASSVNVSAMPAPLPANPSISDFASALNELREYVQSLALLVTQIVRHQPAPAMAPVPAMAASSQAISRQPEVHQSVYPALLLEAIIPQAGCPKEGEILELTGLAVATSDSLLPPAEPPQADITPLHARSTEGQIIGKCRRLRATGGASCVSQSTLDAVKHGHPAADARALRDYLERCGRANSSSIEWVHSQGFTTTVGGARVPSGCSGERAILSLLADCYDVASFGWFSLTGALHCLSVIEHIRFYQVPEPSDELLVCARMTHPTGGFWRADVAVFDPKGRIFAEVSGIEGVPQLSSGVFRCASSDPAERAWQRFSERMQHDDGTPKDVAL